MIHSNPQCVYSTLGRYNRLVVHELCKLIMFPITIETNGEISDDDDDEETAEVGLTFRESLKHENEQLYAVVKEMIDASHSLGPVKILAPSDDNDMEQEHHDDQQQQHQQQLLQPADAPEGESRYQIHQSILTVADKFGKTPLHVLCENY